MTVTINRPNIRAIFEPAKELRLINGCRNDYKWAAKRIMELEEFRRNAFKAHPNIDRDIDNL